MDEINNTILDFFFVRNIPLTVFLIITVILTIMQLFSGLGVGKVITHSLLFPGQSCHGYLVPIYKEKAKTTK